MEVEVGRSTQSIQQLGLWAIEVLYIYIYNFKSVKFNKKNKNKTIVQPLRTNKRANNSKTTPQKLG